VLASEREAGRQELLRHLRGRELPEQLALPVTEALLLQAGADARPEKDRIHRLEEVVLGPHLDAARDAVHLLDRRHHDDRDVAELGIRRQGGQRLIAVHLGHLDVEQDQVDPALPERLQSFLAVLGEAHGVAQLLEGAAKEQPVHPVVVDDEKGSGQRVTG
jgi:hypothetical protein